MKEKYIKQLVLIIWTFTMTIVDSSSLDGSENPLIVVSAVVIAGVLYYICGLAIWVITDFIGGLFGKKA